MLLALGIMLLSVVDSQTDDDWPMFMHDTQHTSFSTTKIPDNPTLLWTFNTDSISHSPIIIGNRVIIGTPHLKTKDGQPTSTVFLLDRSNGKEIWKFDLESWYITSPVYKNKKIYIGSDKGNLYCFDIADKKLVYEKENVCITRAISALLAEENILIGDIIGVLHAFNFTTGSKLWEYKTEDIEGTSIKYQHDPMILSSAAYYEGKLYFGSDNHRLYSLDIGTGQKIWEFEADSEILSSPAISDGIVYFGGSRFFYAVDVRTGGKIWEFDTKEIPKDKWDDIGYCSPAIAYGKIYIGGSLSGNLYALDARTGELIWYFNTGNETHSTPAIADGKVFIGSESKKLYALDVNTGEKIWEYETGGEVFSPAISHGMILVPSSDGKVYAFGESSYSQILYFCRIIGVILLIGVLLYYIYRRFYGINQ
jgi:outer membrane protein assembly factor BamB